MEITLRQNIKEFRNKLNLTQEDLAKYLGISREEVSYYENGKRDVPRHLVPKLANLFGVDEYDLFENEEALNKLNVAFAFRANEVCIDDLNAIAQFKKVALNYLKIKKALLDHEH
ncbi:helix-turn-helix transcriptional regulator [Elizabethkingia anophelis]|nr:helix-turn-helix transcriptional regulator [Elizabethkingia anophelis]MCT3952375.1 helix-turn-helix transcriptional regulator [Elizabethkingia anophelis]MCT3955918.1 helix-turn-helix transcriptional regulator [Elizabethkingia anophelis]MCT3987608.1 helix-turn-helix transcriptional regulator [Elizabethkingia anophelis]MCT4066152.1 helix-turn-helix transcriptional regulator [Elizabethkingia anophelis]